MNPRDDIHHLKGFGGKKECEYPCDHYNTITTTTSLPRIITSSSRQWSSSFKNPRIVRVSRAFGGKDRHSKVCTVRGLRDRRIRLSVPTAIQLYDLQDRLGLSQPSKVVDWLIEAAKLDIDKLPPLPTLPSHFPPHPQSNHPLEAINKQYGHDQDEGFGGFLPPHLSAQNFFPLNTTQLCVPNYNFHLDQLGGGGGYSLATPGTDHQETTSSSSHLYLYPSAPTLPSITPAAFPSYIPQSMENHDHIRQILNLSTSQMNKAAAFSLSMDSKIFYSTEEREDKFFLKK